MITTGKYILRSLRFYWRNHLAVALGVALATAILVGALLVGDSVRYSLERLALLRLGKTKLAVTSPTRFFRSALADELGTTVAPVLMLRGVVTSSDGKGRVNHAQIIGVDDRFWSMGELSAASPKLADGQGMINRQLAGRLGLQPGQTVVVRIEKPSWLPHDAPLSSDKDLTVAARVEVRGIVSDEQMGRFSLQANQISPASVFVPLTWLQRQVNLPGRANVLLSESGAVNVGLGNAWKLADANLELRELPEQKVFELRTDRVFLDPPVAEAILKAVPQTRGVLSYFVNEIRNGDRATPYSIVTAMGRGSLQDDEIEINDWLAEDIQAKVSDSVALKYYVVRLGRALEERTTEFRVKKILPMEGAALDPELKPKFPGLEDKQNCRDWDAGIPIQLNRIREKDEAYWDRYRGTPKAFISLNAGQRMWGNRFGDLTALRWPMEGITREEIESAIHAAINPAMIGLVFQPVGAQAMAASREAIDFGQLFLGFSIFLIVAALLLMGLLFTFGIEQRTEEIGTLLAVGLPARLVRRLLLMEGLSLALVGGMIGTLGGLVYTKAALYGLATVWRGAVSGSEIFFHAEPKTLVIGGVASVFVAWVVIWLSIRRQAKKPARVLLAREGVTLAAGATRRWGLVIGIACMVAALGIVVAAGAQRNAQQAFFCAGGLMLIGGFGLSQAILQSLASVKRTVSVSIGVVGRRNSARRWGRSLTTIGLLACGIFLVVAVGANRHDPNAEAEQRTSGTGGFALFVETTIALSRDLNKPATLENFGLVTNDFAGVRFVGLRVHDGDDASCLNLNRAQTPRLLGVESRELIERGAFAIAGGSSGSWSLLDRDQGDGSVPAIGDEQTVVWALGKKVGDTIGYVDERGRSFQLRIVGMIAPSILQGSLIISENQFIKRFPSESGHRLLLVDAPRERAKEIAGALKLGLRDFGIEARLAAERLAEFNAVENTYLSIFQLIGGLGLLLGSTGLGVVVLRNVLERRSELAILRAVGFSRRLLQWMIVSEHWLLLALGIGCGVVAALVAVLPSLRSSGAEVPVVSLVVTLGVIVVSGVLWIWLAAKAALRGSLMKSLRNE